MDVELTNSRMPSRMEEDYPAITASVARPSPGWQADGTTASHAAAGL